MRCSSARRTVLATLALAGVGAGPVAATTPPPTPPAPAPSAPAPSAPVPAPAAPTAPPSATSPVATSAAPAPLDWGPCVDQGTTLDGVECATLSVPIDHASPTAGHLDLALVRAPARLSRQGAVLFNPGGPGGSGWNPIANSGPYIQRRLGLEHFDVVGFDPRGVDRSGAITCVDGAWLDRELVLDDTPDTPAATQALESSNDRFAAACHARYGDTLRHYSTAETARDMDDIRAALGDEQLSFLGVSYGTYLGAVYATLFPDRVRAMVLDSAYEPNGDTPEQQVLTQLVGFEGALRNWIQWCRTDPSCAFHAPDVAARWTALRHRLDAHPLTVTGRPVNQVVLWRATTASLYATSEWAALGSALAKAESGDGAALLAIADRYNERRPDGSYASIRQSNPVIACASGFELPPPADLPGLLATIHRQAPLLGGDLTLDGLRRETAPECPALVPGAAAEVQVHYDASAPILVVGGTNDPATPIRWATEMTAAMGPSARLVTFTGEGHGQLLTSSCVTDLEAAVLADGQLPIGSPTCAPDPTLSRPSWWSTVPQPAGVGPVVALPSVVAALGLEPTNSYSEVHVTSLDVAAATRAYVSALPGTFRKVAERDLGITDTTAVSFVAPDGSIFVVAALGPRAFDSAELSSAKADVPGDRTVVLLASLAN